LNTRRTLRSNYANSLFGIGFDYDDFLRLRQKNSLNGYLKLTWKATSRHKVNLTMTKFVGIDHGFGRFRVGDEVADASNDRTGYPWAFRDQLDQYPTYIEETTAQILNWKYAVSSRSFSSVSVRTSSTISRSRCKGSDGTSTSHGAKPPTSSM
jgi:hypothetical protein